MKNLLLSALIVFCFIQPGHSQLQGGKSGFYAGLSYSLAFFTDPDVSNVYPSFDFRRNALKSEINPYIGYKPSEQIAFEFSPGFLYSNSTAGDGFYYSQTGLSSDMYYYYPRNAYLLSIPFNFKMKVFPFSAAKSLAVSGIFFSVAGGPIMIKEEYDIDIYENENMFQVIGYRSAVDNIIWTGDMQLSIGYMTQSVLALGFEAGYRFVPLPVDRKYPLASSIAANMNTVLVSVKFGYNF